jgi:putative ABC transport system substrate-binding protein
LADGNCTPGVLRHGSVLQRHKRARRWTWCRHPAAWCYLAAAALALMCTTTSNAQRLIVVSSSEATPYQLALSGIRKQGHPVDVLQWHPENATAVAATVARAGRDAAIVTLGTEASEAVAQAGGTAAVVNCMVFGGGRVPSGTQVVPLDIPVETHIMWMNRLLPKARNVGILFDPAQNERRAVTGAEGLRRAGYVAVLEPVTGPTALPNALNRLTNSIDVLYALPDTTVFAGEHARALLLFAFRNHIPLAGPNEAWVSAGALYAIDWDYADLGRYCAALALHQQAGGRAPPPTPPRTRAIANLRSADQLRIRWSDEVLRQFDKVFQ